MKTIKNNYIFILLTSLFMGFGSCDYLDIVPDNVATIEYAFRNKAAAQKYLYTCYSYRPGIGDLWGDPAMNGCDETWQRYTTQAMWPTFSSSYISRGLQSTNEPYLNFWDGRMNGSALWVGIRDCNTFLESINSVVDLQDYEKKRWIAEVKFLKAYYHYFLMKCYGPIPIVDVNLPVSTSISDVKVYREPIDKVVQYVTDLMAEAVTDLPTASEIVQGTDAGRVDQLAAASMRAQVLLYAASPLFNGNTNYSGMIDSRGEQLFPQTFDANKWKLAADACKEAIELCDAQQKRLYDLVDPQTYNLSDTLQLQTTYRQAICDRWNSELLWGNTNNNNNMLAQYSTPRLMRLKERLNEWNAEWAPTIKLVENYYSSNGVPIEEDKEWQNNGWFSDRFKIRDLPATHQERYYVKEGQQTVNLHYNREPRFYASIGFDRGIYFGSGYYEFPGNVKHCEFRNLEVSGFQGGSAYSGTGYAAKKMNSFKAPQNDEAVTREYFPFPIIRLADLYLMYAEALNEFGGPSEEIFTYLDKIRTRAGLKGVKESWQNYSTNPSKPDTKEGLRSIIHRERTIELALEGKRFWDIRRWKEIDAMNVQPQGWNVMGETIEDFYKVVVLPQVPVKMAVKDYFWPIKESNLSINPNLIQNYGW